jgi:hypothetical protein
MMDHTTIAGSAGASPTISGSFLWTPADTQPGAIAAPEPEIAFLTLADIHADPTRRSARADVVSAFVSGAMMSALAARAARMRRRALKRAAR